LTDPYINEFLQAFIQFHGFDVADQSHISQLHTSIFFHFVSTTMPTINPNLNKRALKEGVVVGPGNTTPLQLGFSTVTLPEEWTSDYQPLSIKYPQLASITPNQLQIVPKADGSTILRFTNPQLMRNISHS